MLDDPSDAKIVWRLASLLDTRACELAETLSGSSSGGGQGGGSTPAPDEMLYIEGLYEQALTHYERAADLDPRYGDRAEEAAARAADALAEVTAARNRLVSLSRAPSAS